MKNIIKIAATLSIIFISGCTGPRASMGEYMQDNFIGTTARPTPEKQDRCLTLVKPFTFESGVVTFSLPAGRYVARQQNGSGYFYRAPSRISSSNWLVALPPVGIYLNNQGTSGNLYEYQYGPTRGVVLPSNIFAFIRNNGKC